MKYTYEKTEIKKTAELISAEMAEEIYNRKNNGKFAYNWDFSKWNFNEWYYDKKNDILYSGWNNTAIVYNMFM
jgi:hypothetical protein